MTLSDLMWTKPLTYGKGSSWRYHLTPTILPPESERVSGRIQALCGALVTDRHPRTNDLPRQDRACSKCLSRGGSR